MGTRIEYKSLYGNGNNDPVSSLLCVDGVNILLDCGWDDDPQFGHAAAHPRGRSMHVEQPTILRHFISPSSSPWPQPLILFGTLPNTMGEKGNTSQWFPHRPLASSDEDSSSGGQLLYAAGPGRDRCYPHITSRPCSLGSTPLPGWQTQAGGAHLCNCGLPQNGARCSCTIRSCPACWLQIFDLFTLDDVDAAFGLMRQLKFQQLTKLTGEANACCSWP